jgi:gluconokinase
MGVSGSGKTTVGRAIAARLELAFIEGDDHHPAANVEKMAAGVPLTDDDRIPWLEGLAALVASHHQRGEGTVLACSALRRSYRDILRTAAPDETFIIHLAVDVETLRTRMLARAGHFMPTSLLASQLETLEPLQDDEAGVTIDATRALAVVIDEALAAVNGGVD